MKQSIFSLFFLFLTAITNSYEFHSEAIGKEIFVRKNISFSDYNILILEDNSIWTIYPIHKRKQTWSEWWNNIQPQQPEEVFLFDFSHWDTNSLLQAYEIFWDELLDKKIEKYNQPNIAKCSHILMNVNTRKIAFAKPLSAEDLLNTLLKMTENEYEKGYKKGYSKGHHAGYLDGCSSGHSTGYNKGKREGYSEGHRVGYQDGYRAKTEELFPPSAPPLDEENGVDY